MGAAEDRSTCVEMLPRVSRTFALSIEALPDEVREAVRVAYLLCRVVDSVEDATGLDADQRRRLFDRFDDLMTGAVDDVGPLRDAAPTLASISDDDRELLVRCDAVFRRYWSLPGGQRADVRGPVLRMSRGMRAWSERHDREGRLRLRDLAELERYCYDVAGTVGELLTALFLRRFPVRTGDADPRADVVARLQGHAVAFGTGLQLVNILKDVAEDAQRGVCYVPESLLADHGLDARGLLAPASRSAGLAALAPMIERARACLDDAIEYTRAWPAATTAPVRLFLIVPLVLALRTLDLIEAGGPDVLVPGRTPKVTRAEVAALLQRAHAAAADDGALDALISDQGRRSGPGLRLHATARPITVDARAYLQRCAARVERDLDRRVPELGQDAGLSAASRYAMLGGGKRLRPVLMMAAAEAIGGDPATVLPFASALEMVHVYSLVHDDLPAMDDALLRRGRPSCHAAHGEATAILVGDALLTDAFAVCADPALEGVTTEARLEFVLGLARAAGGHGMVRGQALDLEAEDRAVGLGELERIHAHKTGRLLQFAVEGAAIVLGADPEVRTRLREYGADVGLAFQIADDVLDATADVETLGKDVGADAANHKSTFVSLLGVEESRARAVALVERAIATLAPLGRRADALRALARFAVERAA